jgi:hypothetical protein
MHENSKSIETSLDAADMNVRATTALGSFALVIRQKIPAWRIVIFINH